MWPFVVLSITVILIDRVSKLYIFEKFSPGFSSPILNNLLYITPVRNRGIAFGLFKGFHLTALILACVFTLLITVYVLFAEKPKSRVVMLSLSLILSGALANLIDRVAYGYVLDFIDLRIWPVFNVADSSITIGALLMLIYLISQKTQKPLK